MPWSRNNNVVLDTLEITNLYYQVQQRVRFNFYRSRKPIDTDLIKDIILPFYIYADATVRTVMNRFNSISMPREETLEASVGRVQEQLQQHMRQNNNSRVITFINVANYNAPAPLLIESLIASGWEEKDFRAALTCTPFHTVRVFTIQATHLNYPHVVILTNDICDDLILKLGAVLPALYNFTLPEDLAVAYLECDKEKFSTALEKATGSIAEERRREELQEGLARLTSVVNRTTGKERYEQELHNNQDNLAQYEEYIREALRKIQELNERIAGIDWGKTETTAEEFIKYLTDHELDKITKIAVERGSSSAGFQVVTELLYWDEALFENYVQSTRDNCYTSARPDMQYLLKDLLLYKRIKMTWHTGIHVNFTNFTIQRNTSILSAGTSKIGMPHPHTYWFNCWGNNKTPIVKALSSGDLIIAWEQIKSAMSGLNMSDSAVLREFVRQLQDNCRNIPCLTVVATGERLSYTTYKNKYPQGVPVPETEAIETVSVEVRKQRRKVEVDE